MPGPWQVNADQFDGGKFSIRYGVQSRPGQKDFWYEYHEDGLGYVHLADGVALNPPDDPPVFESPG